MADSKRKVLITGCSQGGMGAELAKEFHKAGLHVYATARDLAKMEELRTLGIETLPLDIQSTPSIEACVKRIPSLDILINNAGALHMMPIADLDIPSAKKAFDLNVWSQIEVTQAFLPLLLASPKAIIANHTSVGGSISLPFQGVYNASKAAMTRFSDTMRLELAGFGITVVELRTANVTTNVVRNAQAKEARLPADSIYGPAREIVEEAMRVEWAEDGIAANQWAKEVVGDLLKGRPPPVVRRGKSSFLAWVAEFMPFGAFDGMFKKMTKLDEVEKVVGKK